MQSRAVLEAVLALSSVQTWENKSFSMEASMLRMRQQAIRGCHQLITRVMGRSDMREGIRQSSSIGDAFRAVAHKAPLNDGNEIVHLLATCDLLLLYEKLSSGDLSVTDDAFASWDGRLDWFPSFALNPPQAADTHERLPTSGSVFVNDAFFRQLDKPLVVESPMVRLIADILVCGVIHEQRDLRTEGRDDGDTLRHINQRRSSVCNVATLEQNGTALENVVCYFVNEKDTYFSSP